MSCDICGKSGDALLLREDLVDQRMSHICDSCNSEARDRVWRLTYALSWKAVLDLMQSEKRGPQKLSLWQRIFGPSRRVRLLLAALDAALEAEKQARTQRLDYALLGQTKETPHD